MTSRPASDLDYSALPHDDPLRRLHEAIEAMRGPGREPPEWTFEDPLDELRHQIALMRAARAVEGGPLIRAARAVERFLRLGRPA